jgi:rhodanese-related sulfurtransferase
MVGISSVEVKQKLDAGEKPFLLDVRSPQEFEEMRLGVGEINVPLGKCRETTDFLPKDKDAEIITYCKISLRGYEAACFLIGMGYTNVKVMEGGLIAWPFPRER